MQKVRSYLVFKLRFLLLIKLPVQDLFTSYLLTFQLSLTVLFTIAQCIISQPQRMVPLYSDKLSLILLTTFLTSNLKVVVIPKLYNGSELILIITGLSPSMVCHSKQILTLIRKQANSLSLTTTNEISVDFFSFYYLDVSVRRVIIIMVSLRIIVIIKSFITIFGINYLLQMHWLVIPDSLFFILVIHYISLLDTYFIYLYSFYNIYKPYNY